MSDEVRTQDTFQDPQSAALFLGLALGAVVYVASHSFGWPVLVYLPVSGTWTWHEPAGAISMHYYGVVLWGLTFGALGAGLGRIPAIARRLPARLTITLSMAIFAGSLAYFLIRELTHWA